MADIKSFPNNQDTYVGAEWLMKWFHGRTSGVFGADQNAAVAPVPNEMQVTVSDGIGWMANNSGDGIVWWNDYEEQNNEKLTLSIDIADAVLSRIDRVVVTWQTTNYVALPTITILKGTAAQVPAAPGLTNNNTQRQISLARILVPAGSTYISSANITDERMDETVCGLVNETIGVDTSVIQNQMSLLLETIREELREINDGSIYELKKYYFSDTEVEPGDFEQMDPDDDDYNEEFPYRGTVPLENVLSTGIPEVVFGITESMSGMFASIAATYDGGIYIYASGVPEDNIVIPTIIIWR